MALMTAYFVVLLTTTFVVNLPPIELGAQQALAFAVPPWVDFGMSILQSFVILGVFLLFPTGRFVPRWSLALLVAFVAYTVVFTYAPMYAPELQTPLVIGWPLFFVGAAACIAYRYWRASSPMERQQTKWVVVGFVIYLVI